MNNPLRKLKQITALCSKGLFCLCVYKGTLLTLQFNVM